MKDFFEQRPLKDQEDIKEMFKKTYEVCMEKDIRNYCIICIDTDNKIISGGSVTDKLDVMFMIQQLVEMMKRIDTYTNLPKN